MSPGSPQYVIAQQSTPQADSHRQPVAGRKRIRVILLDLWCFIPYYVAAITKALCGEDVEAQLLCSSYHFDPHYFRANGLTNNAGYFDVVSHIKIGSSWLRRCLKLVEYCANLAVLSAKLMFAPPDIMHLQYLALLEHGIPAEIWMLRLARRRGVKLACTVHNILPHDTGERHRRAFHRLYQLCNLLISHNESTKQLLQHEFGISPERIRVIPHGPLQQAKTFMSAADARARLQLPKDRVVVLWQGVIVPYKGIEFLLDSWKNVSSSACLVIAGRGKKALLEKLKKKVNEQGPEQMRNIRLDLEFISPELLPYYYQAADIIVYPYRQITTSGALMTGLGYGKAIVATNLPAFAEMLTNDENALLVEYGDAAGLAAGINSLVESRSLRERLGAQAELLMKTRYSWNQIALETRACYDTLLGE